MIERLSSGQSDPSSYTDSNALESGGWEWTDDYGSLPSLGTMFAVEHWHLNTFRRFSYKVRGVNRPLRPRDGLLSFFPW